MPTAERPGPRETYRLQEFFTPLNPDVFPVEREERVVVEVVRGYQLVYARYFKGENSQGVLDDFSAPMPQPPEGADILVYAASLPADVVVGYAEVRQLIGTPKIDGIDVPVQSERFYPTGVCYIDAQVFPSIDDAVKNAGAPREVLKDFMRSHETPMAVLTRAETWEPFLNGDSVVSTPAPVNQGAPISA